MIVTTLLGIITVILAYLAKYKNVQLGLKTSFILILIFLALRYNFGNDYKKYPQGFIKY